MNYLLLLSSLLLPNAVRAEIADYHAPITPALYFGRVTSSVEKSRSVYGLVGNVAGPGDRFALHRTRLSLSNECAVKGEAERTARATAGDSNLGLLSLFERTEEKVAILSDRETSKLQQNTDAYVLSDLPTATVHRPLAYIDLELNGPRTNQSVVVRLSPGDFVVNRNPGRKSIRLNTEVRRRVEASLKHHHWAWTDVWGRARLIAAEGDFDGSIDLHNEDVRRTFGVVTARDVVKFARACAFALVPISF